MYFNNARLDHARKESRRTAVPFNFKNATIPPFDSTAQHVKSKDFAPFVTTPLLFLSLPSHTNLSLSLHQLGYDKWIFKDDKDDSDADEEEVDCIL